MSVAESYVEKSDEAIAKACKALASAASFERLGMKKSSALMREVASLGFRLAGAMSALSTHPGDFGRVLDVMVEVWLVSRECDRLTAELARAVKEESK